MISSSSNSELVITRKVGGKLITTREMVNSWNEIENHITKYCNESSDFTLNDESGQTVFYMMTDGKLVHMSIWRESRCAYFCPKNWQDLISDYSDIGWNAFPAWTVVDKIESALSALAKYFESGELVSWGCWKEEEIEL